MANKFKIILDHAEQFSTDAPKTTSKIQKNELETSLVIHLR